VHALDNNTGLDHLGNGSFGSPLREINVALNIATLVAASAKAMVLEVGKDVENKDGSILNGRRKTVYPLRSQRGYVPGRSEGEDITKVQRIISFPLTRTGPYLKDLVSGHGKL
jgi:hypothetical protein